MVTISSRPARGPLPPASRCPSWCVERPHPWESDGPDFYRSHRSRDISPAPDRFTMEARQAEFWADGELHRGGLHVWLDGPHGLVIVDAAGCLAVMR